MKITSIPQLYRNVSRWREILAVLRRYGLADWLSQFPRFPFSDLLKDTTGMPLSKYSREQRIRLALTELGPTFVKLGQILSARPDLIGPTLAGELRTLHADVRPLPVDVIKETLSRELGAAAQEELGEIDEEPLAAASIGQVHRATLRDGTPVVVKVQRPDIESTVERDLDVLAGLAQLAERAAILSGWGPAEMVAQIRPMLLRELDFHRERQNLELFREFFDAESGITIPKPYPRLCTRRVLVMQRLEGEPLLKTAAANGGLSCAEKQELAQLIASTYLEMIFKHGVFHADPHPGNLIRLRDGGVGILDFGMIGRLDDRTRQSIEEMLLAISAGDSQLLTRLIRRVGRAPAEIDESLLAIDAADFVATYGRQSVDQFDVTGAINRISEILHDHSISLPSQSALLLKMMLSLEGTLRGLGASFSTLEVTSGLLRQSILKGLSPRRRALQIRRIYLEAEYFFEQIPDQVLTLLDQARHGRLGIHLNHHKLGPSVNRLVMGMLASSLFLGSALMLSTEVPPVLFAEPTALGLHRVSILGLSGVVVSILIMLRLMRSIGRSGHLDQRE